MKLTQLEANRIQDQSMKALINRHDFHRKGINNNNKWKNNKSGTKKQLRRSFFFHRSLRVAEEAHLCHPFSIFLVKKDRFRMFVVVGRTINSLSESNILRKFQFAQKKTFPSFSRYAVTRFRVITIRHQEDCVTARGWVWRDRSGKFFLLHNLNREDENLLGDAATLCKNINGLLVCSQNLSLCFVRHYTPSNSYESEIVKRLFVCFSSARFSVSKSSSLILC